MLGIYAIGSGFVIVTGGIDLSVGSMVGLTGVHHRQDLVAGARAACGHSLALGIVVALAVALLIGLVQGLLITRLNLQPFIVTLGGMLLIRGVSQTIVQGGTLSMGTSPLLQAGQRRAVQASTAIRWCPTPLLIFLGVIALGGVRAALHGVRPLRLRDRRQPRRRGQYSGINVKRGRDVDLRDLRGPGRRGGRLLRGLHRPDVAAGRRRLRALRHRRRRARRLLAARRRGDRPRHRDRLGDDAGHRQRHQHVPAPLQRRRRHPAPLAARTRTGRSSSSARSS